MCGRYVSPDTAEIERQFAIGRENSNPFRRRFNVLPTDPVPIVRSTQDAVERALVSARWGFAPGWWKEKKPPSNCFNARSEEAPTKPMWRYSLAKARCLLPAEGWYEWRAVQQPDPDTAEIKVVKRPHYIFRQDRRLIAMAGLMSLWYPTPDSAVLTCAILTRDAAGPASDVHDRMPVILNGGQIDTWLDHRIEDLGTIQAIITASQTDFVHYPVTPALNSAKTDEEEFVKPWEPSQSSPRQGTLGI